MIFPCPKAFGYVVCGLGMWFDSDFSLCKQNVVLCSSVTSYMSGSFLLVMLLYLWLMLLLVVSWIAATNFSRVYPTLIYVNFSASKIVQQELYQTPVDTQV